MAPSGTTTAKRPLQPPGPRTHRQLESHSESNTVPATIRRSNGLPLIEIPGSQSQEAIADLRGGIDPGDPLTVKGRIKKRLRDKDSYDPDDPDRYRYKSYHIRRAFDLYGHLPTIINDGIKRRAKEFAGEAATGVQSDRDYETFQLIVNHLEGLNDEILRLKRNPKAFRALVRKIREAADQARNNDTANLKKDIACMLTPDGSSVLTVMMKGKKASSKHDRGFDNEVMGRHLCPISLDWDDPTVRSEIQDGQHAILASDWPRLLYADCHCNLDDLEAGLGRNMALVRVVKYLFTGRSAAFSETAGGKTTRSGNAALAGMKEISPRVVAYAACMLRYSISNEESWAPVDKEFNMEEFYWHVVSIFDESEEFGQDLLTWWNMKIFGTSIETSLKPEATCSTAALSMLRMQRQAKRAAKQVLGNITNRIDGQEELERANTPESEDGEVEPTAVTVPQCSSPIPSPSSPRNTGENETPPPRSRLGSHSPVSRSPRHRSVTGGGHSAEANAQRSGQYGFVHSSGTAPSCSFSTNPRATTPSVYRAYADSQPRADLSTAYYPQIANYHVPPPGMAPMMYRPISYAQIGPPPPPPWPVRYPGTDKTNQSVVEHSKQPC